MLVLVIHELFQETTLPQLPDWMAVIRWEAPHRMRDLMTDKSRIPEYPGFYAFNLDLKSLLPGRVLYIGQTADKGGFRARLRKDYLRQDPASASTRHKAALFLQDHKIQNPAESIYVRWCLFETDTSTRLHLETAMMQFYQAWYNTAGMKSYTPFDTI